MKPLEKETLRRRGRDLRKGIVNRAALSDEICERIMNWNLFAASGRIMSYCSIDGEADLSAVNDAAAAVGELYLPAVILDKGISLIEPRRFFKRELCVKGKYGISEPPPGAEAVKPELIEFIFVPGIMFTRQGGRIGFGRGYYDRFLTSCVHARKAGVCFEAQLEENFEMDENDVRMDFVITEKRIYKGEK